MKSIDLLEAIGEIDEKLLENKNKKPKKALIISLAAAVACIALIFTSYFPFEKGSDIPAPNSKNEVVSGGTAVLASDDIDIYYVENGEIKSEVKYLDCAPETIFNAWKVINHIGEEVKMISSKVESNATTSRYEIAGQEVVAHTVGDYFIYNLTVSKELENYYGENQNLLLESLEKTMTGFSHIGYDEFNLFLE